MSLLQHLLGVHIPRTCQPLCERCRPKKPAPNWAEREAASGLHGLIDPDIKVTVVSISGQRHQEGRGTAQR
jgi:hypothetical protein